MKSSEDNSVQHQYRNETRQRPTTGKRQGDDHQEDTDRTEIINEEARRNTADPEHMEIHEEIDDDEPTFYNNTKRVHLKLNDSPSRTANEEGAMPLENQNNSKM